MAEPHSIIDPSSADPLAQGILQLARRQFLGAASLGIGAAAMASLAGGAGVPLRVLAAPASPAVPGPDGASLPAPHFPAKAKRVIYLHQAGAPSQLDFFDHKPGLVPLRGKLLPASVHGNQRVTELSAGKPMVLAPALRPFNRYGACGRWISPLAPHIGSIADEICFIHSMNTEQINHAPAITFMQTGSPLAGRPSMGAWASYGLGNANQNLPAFVVLTSSPKGSDCGQPLYEHLWGSGFLPAAHQGTKLRGAADPVLFLKNPAGVPAPLRRAMLDSLAAANHVREAEVCDPEISARMTQYELAYRMQTSVPELTDLSGEPEETFMLYGPLARQPGSYAWNCLMARRLAERGVRFVQVYQTGWDSHSNLPREQLRMIQDTDRPSAALVMDLKRRGLLDDTLVVWGGEFGRGVTIQGNLDDNRYGRDHHGRCFTVWMAGAGVKPGHAHGKTDDFSYNVVEDGVHVHDLQATLLERLGFDHERLTYRAQGRDFRLTDVHGKVVRGVLA